MLNVTERLLDVVQIFMAVLFTIENQQMLIPIIQI